MATRDAGGNANLNFRYGGRGNVALSGDWDGNGKAGIGIYDPARMEFRLK